jgi:hypothetical protein
VPQIAPNSARRGFLLPGTGAAFALGQPYGWDQGYWDASRLPLTGQALDDFMQQIVAGITGLPGDLVRPRWQVEPTTLPDIDTNWLAVGVTRSTPLGFPAAVEVYNPTTGAAFSQQSDQEEFELLCSAYGPAADAYAVAIRSGFMVAQNREALQLVGVGLVQTSGRTRLPTLLKEQWWMRVDITVTLRREVRNFYPVLSLLSGEVQVITDVGYATDRVAG